MTSLNHLAQHYCTQEKYDHAEPLYKRILLIKEKAYRPDHPELVTSLNVLASNYDDQHKYDQAEPLYKADSVDQGESSRIGPPRRGQ